MVFSFNAFQLRASVRSEFPAHLLTWEGMTGHYAHTQQGSPKNSFACMPTTSKGQHRSTEVGKEQRIYRIRPSCFSLQKPTARPRFAHMQRLSIFVEEQIWTRAVHQ